MAYRKHPLAGIAALVFFLMIFTACSPKEAPTDTGSSTAAAFADAPDSAYSQELEAFEVGTAEISDEKAVVTSADIAVAEGLSAKTTVRYSGSAKGNFSGTMTVGLHKTGTGPSRFVLNISKSFAASMSQLTFSIKPDQVIQDDPVAAWDISKDSTITIKSVKSFSREEMKSAAAEQAFGFQYEACEKLPSLEESTICEWRLVERYRDQPFMKDYLSGMNLASAEGAALRSLMDGNYGMCVKYISGAEEDRCLQWVFRTREYECRSEPDPAACVRKILWPIGLDNIRALCGFISDPGMKKECQGKVSPDVCMELTDLEEKNKCLINIARTSRDVKDCEKIGSLEAKDECLKYLGTDNNDAGACEGIKDPDTKDECIADVAIQSKDKDLCDKVADDDARGLCQVYLMSTEGKIDRSKCDRMKDGWIKDMCMSCYAVSIKDMAMCDQVKDTDSLHLCQMMVGVVLKDASICLTFKDVSDKDLCYSMFGLILDKKYCEKIENEEMKKDCQKTPLPGPAKDANATSLPNATSAAAASPGQCPVSAPASAIKYDQASDSGGWMIRYATTGGVPVGPEIYYYDKEKARMASSKCYDLQGQLHGPFAIYNRDGTKYQEGSYRNGKMDGVFRQWRQGTLDRLDTYKDGRPDGPVESYVTEPGPAFGKMLYSGSYLGYKKVGDWKYYNGVTGALEEEATYDNDCRTKDKEYYEEGSVSMEQSGTCKNGKFTGTQVQYARPANGVQAKTTCQIVDDKIVSCV